MIYYCQCRGCPNGYQSAFEAAPESWWYSKGLSLPKNCKSCLRIKKRYDEEGDIVFYCEMCGKEIPQPAEYRWMQHKNNGPYAPPRICRKCEKWGNVEYKILSSKSERIRYTRKNGVIWDSLTERGNGLCIPLDGYIQKVLWGYGQTGVFYKDGIPDFTPFKEAQIMIGEITSSRIKNMRKANKRFAKDFTIEDLGNIVNMSVEEYVRKLCELGQYTWHECNDRKTMILIPSIIHWYFKHLGGVSEAKKSIQSRSERKEPS